MPPLTLPVPPARGYAVAASNKPAPLRLLHLWHLLSLDAPTVATVWTAFIARSCQVRLPATTLVAMFLMVWVLYAADRLLDAQPLHRQPTVSAGLEHRHLFHHRHRRAFLLTLGLVTLLLAALIPQMLAASLHLFLILGTLLAGYFILIHATSGAHRLPKEIAVGLFFSAAVFIPTVARLIPSTRPLIPLALLFAALCCLNCLCIFAWEHPLAAATEPHRLTLSASRHRRNIATTLLAASLLCAATLPHLVIAGAVCLSSFSLLLLDRRHHQLSPLTLRAAADLALLTPALLLPWMLRR